MASDLHRCGYKRTDILRIYGFNLILLPVNLAGVVKSMQQAVTGKKIPFARTPKVDNRTATPLLFALSPLLIIGYSVLAFLRDFHAHNWGNAAFAGAQHARGRATPCSPSWACATRSSTSGSAWSNACTSPTCPKEVQVVRPRRAVAVRAAQPEWEDVLFRGDPGTETGEHYDGEGTFKILATPRVAPPKHDRRASDRAGADGQFKRRASDRGDGPFERRASDRGDGPFERRASDRERRSRAGPGSRPALVGRSATSRELAGDPRGGRSRG